jgi:uncharacterized membrane protein
VIGVLLGIIVSIIVTVIIAANPFAWGALAITGTLTTIISIAILIVAVLAMIKAYKYEEYRLPLIGNFAASLTERFGK